MAGPTKIKRQLIESLLKDWTPSWGAGGSMTISNIVPAYKKYSIGNNDLEFQLIVDVDLGGTPSNEITFTLPNSPIYLQPIAQAEYTKFEASILVAGDWIALNGIIRPTHGELFKFDSSNFDTGTGLKLSVKGKYEITIP